MNAAETSINTSGIRNSTNTNSLNINGCFDNSKNCEPIRIVRQYINPAVYVESSIYDMAPFRRSPVFLNYSSDDEYIHKVVKVKKCVCFTNPNHCPCHPNTSQTHTNIDCDYECSKDEKTFFNKETRGRSLSSQVSLCISDTDSKITVKRYQDELKLSLPSTSTSTLRCVDDNQRDEAYKTWCAKKDQERKLKEEKDQLIKEIKQKEKELQLEQERENFKKWLASKKKDEEKRKKDKEKEVENERVKQEVKDKRLQENELSYQLWLRKKEELCLEKRINEHVKLLQKEEEKQRRLQESVRAYEGWLKHSKNKPKPIPLNQGLQTLRSSVSVTYVNPTPWVPNIDLKSKPASQ